MNACACVWVYGSIRCNNNCIGIVLSETVLQIESKHCAFRNIRTGRTENNGANQNNAHSHTAQCMHTAHRKKQVFNYIACIASQPTSRTDWIRVLWLILKAKCTINHVLMHFSFDAWINFKFKLYATDIKLHSNQARSTRFYKLSNEAQTMHGVNVLCD